MRSRRFLILGAVLLLPLLGLAVVAALMLRGRPQPEAAELLAPRPVYLALGDSVGYGYQPNFDITNGYADLLFARLREQGAEQLVNLSCPGETSGSMLAGSCRMRSLAKSRYEGSQYEQARAVIRANPGRVGPVTLTIGANDVLSELGPQCAENVPGFDAALARLDTNLDTILGGLRQELGGAGALVLTTYYNPYEQACPNTAPYLLRLNQQLTAAAQRHGVRVVDISYLFAGRTCELTWMCSRYRDIHATTAGYQLMADRLLIAFTQR